MTEVFEEVIYRQLFLSKRKIHKVNRTAFLII